MLIHNKRLPLGSLLKSSLEKPDSLDTVNQANIVYTIECDSCPVSNKGHSSRFFLVKITEHAKVVHNNNELNRLAKYCYETEHFLKWESARISKKNITSYFERLWYESWVSKLEQML